MVGKLAPMTLINKKQNKERIKMQKNKNYRQELLKIFQDKSIYQMKVWIYQLKNKL